MIVQEFHESQFIDEFSVATVYESHHAQFLMSKSDLYRRFTEG